MFIRPAEIADMLGLVALEKAAFAEDRLSARSFRHLLTRGHGACHVATENDTIVGCAVTFFRRNAKVARLHSLAVAPPAQGRGVARALLAYAEAEAAARGARVLRLAVRIDNKAAERLYQSCGYTELNRELAYYSDGVSALHMEKVLAVAR